VISSDGWRTKPDGTFYVTVWPGKGVLDIRANDSGKYMSVDVEKILSEAGIRSRPVGSVHGLVPIDVNEARPESVDVTITLQDGSIRKGTVVGPGPLKTGEFNLSGMSPTSRRLLLFLDEGKKLAAIEPVTGDGSDAIAVKLQPLGSAEGEVQLANKALISGLTVTAIPYVADANKYENLPSETLKRQGVFGMQKAPWWNLTKRTATTDKAGRFRLEGLIPGLEYSIHVSDGDYGEAGTLVTQRTGIKVEPGKTMELGVFRSEK
jgi:hypothetical protein